MRKDDLSQKPSALFPIGHAASEESIESRRVVVVHEVAEFVHDDVFDAMDRSVDQLDIENDPTSGRAASPPSSHASDCDGRFLHSVPVSDFHAAHEVAAENVVGSGAIPGVKCCLDGFGVALLADDDMEEPTPEFGGLSFSCQNLEAVLPSQINESLAADELVECW